MARKPDVGQLRNDAAKALERGKLDKAIELYTELEAAEPTAPAWPKKIGEIHRRDNDPAAAVAAFERAAEKYAVAGFLVQAIAVCKMILQIDPDHSATQIRLSELMPKPAARAAELRPDTAPLVYDDETDEPVRETPARFTRAETAPATPTARTSTRDRDLAGVATRVRDEVALRDALRQAEAGMPRTSTRERDLAAAASRARDEAGAAQASTRDRNLATAANRVRDDKAAHRENLQQLDDAGTPAARTSTRDIPVLVRPRDEAAPATARTSSRDLDVAAAAARMRDEKAAKRELLRQRTEPGVPALPVSAVSPGSEPVQPAGSASRPAAASPRTGPSATPRPPTAPGGAPPTPAASRGSTDDARRAGRPDAAPYRLLDDAVTAPRASRPLPRAQTVPATPTARAAQQPPEPSEFPVRPPTRLPKPVPKRVVPMPSAGPPFADTTVPTGDARRARAPSRPAVIIDRPRPLTVEIPPGGGLDQIDLSTLIPGSVQIIRDDGTYSGVNLLPLGEDEFSLDDAEPVTDRTPGLAARRALLTTPLFPQVSPRVLEQLIEHMTLLELAPDEVLFREGETGNELFVISEGEVAVESAGVGELARLGPSAFFGEIALVTDLPRSATIRAITSVELLAIDRGVIRQASKDHPEIITVLLRFVRDRLIDRITRTSELFRPFSEPERHALSARFELVEVVPDAILITQGERADGLYLVVAGHVEVWRDGQGALATLGSGDVFGELSLLANTGSTANVRATTRVLALRMPASTFQEVIMTHPQVLAYLGELAERRTPRARAEEFVDLHLDMLV